MRSIGVLFLAASWAEREAFDLFGIVFWEHYDFRRILTDYGFCGFPFQRNFPVFGLEELNFSDEVGSLVYSRVSFAQRFRNFGLFGYSR